MIYNHMNSMQFKTLVRECISEELDRRFDDMNLYFNLMSRNPELDSDYRNLLHGNISENDFIEKLNTTIKYEISTYAAFEIEKSHSITSLSPLTPERLQFILDKLKVGEDLLRNKKVGDVVKDRINIINKESSAMTLSCLVKRIPPFFPVKEEFKVNDLWLIAVITVIRGSTDPTYARWMTKLAPDSKENDSFSTKINATIIPRRFLKNSTYRMFKADIEHQDPE